MSILRYTLTGPEGAYGSVGCVPAILCLLYVTSTGDWLLSTHTYSNEHRVLAMSTKY